MSEYQYYEWQAIDRPLTNREQDQVDDLSSHITVSASGAWVDYSWGDFKHDPLQVLADYFDAYVYLSNWGTRELAFRLPADIVDENALQPYLLANYIALTHKGEHYILYFSLSDEDPSSEWIEPGNWLGPMAALRNDILRGDYRVLYLAWLHGMDLQSDYSYSAYDTEKVEEPPVPENLGRLSSALQAFVDFFEIDSHLVTVAAQASPSASQVTDESLIVALGKLSRQECEEFLARLLRGEAHLSLALRQRLQAFTSSASHVPKSSSRTADELLAQRDSVLEAERERKAEAERRRHAQEMEALAQREGAVWQAVEEKIETYKPKEYDEATALLDKLEALAAFQQTQASFQKRMDDLLGRYSRRSSLMARWEKRGWLP